MNDFELNGGEINGDKQIYSDDGSAAFLFYTDGYGQNAILGAGSVQVIHTATLSQQVKKFLSGSASSVFSQNELPAQVKKQLTGNTQFQIDANALGTRYANAVGSAVSQFVFTGDAKISGPARALFQIQLNADVDAAVHRVVFGYPKQQYIEARAVIPEFRNKTHHVEGRSAFRLSSNGFVGQRLGAESIAVIQAYSDADLRIGGKLQLSGESLISLFVGGSLSTINYIYLSGEATIRLSAQWGLDSKPDHQFGFIKAKPDRIIKVPMDSRKLIIPLGVL